MRRNTLFSQLLQLICHYRFKKCVDRYDGDRYTKRFSCWQQLLVLLFAQAKGLTSLRDIEISLRSHHQKWYHLGLTNIARSTLADANGKRDWRIYADFAGILIQQAKKLYAATALPVDLDATAYALDSTVIDLCMSMFPSKSRLMLRYLINNS